jgi:hypothetical protein
LAVRGAPLDIVVEELALDGIDVDDPAVAAALARTLGSVLREQGVERATTPVVAAVVARVGRAVEES